VLARTDGRKTHHQLAVLRGSSRVFYIGTSSRCKCRLRSVAVHLTKDAFSMHAWEATGHMLHVMTR
jgi:hypothetical protein